MEGDRGREGKRRRDPEPDEGNISPAVHEEIFEVLDVDEWVEWEHRQGTKMLVKEIGREELEDTKSIPLCDVVDGVLLDMGENPRLNERCT